MSGAQREAHEWDPPVRASPEEAEQELAGRLGDELSGLIEVVRFGHDTEQFITQSKVGQYLVNKAETELNEATRQLLDMDSPRGKKARDVFQKAKTAVLVLQWLNDAITAGREAERTILALDATEGSHEG